MIYLFYRIFYTAIGWPINSFEDRLYWCLACSKCQKSVNCTRFSHFMWWSSNTSLWVHNSLYGKQSFN